MAAKARPTTEFPSPDVSTSLKSLEENFKGSHYTRFPGGLSLQRFHLTETSGGPDIEPSVTTIRTSPISLQVNPPSAVPTRPIPENKIRLDSENHLPTLEIKDPWESYIALRLLERGGEVIAACNRIAPIEVVAVKTLSSDHFKQFRNCRQENLLTIKEAYRFQGQFFAITDYTATTLRHIIALSLPLEEIHISVTCRQGSFSFRFGNCQFNGTRFGIAHKSLDASKVLFMADGCVKIAHFDDCQSTESAFARPLGIIAIEMMQKGISPAQNEKLVLYKLDKWSPEAANFIEITN